MIPPAFSFKSVSLVKRICYSLLIDQYDKLIPSCWLTGVSNLLIVSFDIWLVLGFINISLDIPLQ